MSSLSWKCETCGLMNVHNIECQACKTKATNDHRDKVVTDCKELLKKYNQSHVLGHINNIQSNSDLNSLIEQIYSIDFAYIDKLYKRAMDEEKAIIDDAEKKKDDDKFTPFPHRDAFNISDIGDISKLVSLGYEAIISGKCSIIILAGGQGTRLGFNKPKGCYNINLPSNKSIYQLQIEKVLAIKRAACRANGISEIQNIRFPIYFMTSQSTHNQTKTFLNTNRHFKYDYFDIKLFKQQLFPCLNELDGKVIMKSASEIAMSPNGNGGIYSSLKKSGILKEMIANKIEYVQIFGIDNILARIGDPLWFGHMIESGADSSNKTCIKKDPHEKIGIMCCKYGKPAVTEYTELTKEMIELRQKDNKQNDLEYCYGNLAMHQFNMQFVSKICNNDDEKDNKYPLPIHVARKKIAYYDIKQMKTIEPEINNGIKLEFFVFDTYQYAEKCTVYNILREEEFAPVKNANGKDSPLTARIAHSKYWKQQIIKNGGKFENNHALNNDELICEVSPLFGYLPYGDDQFKKRVHGKTFKLPTYLTCD